MADSPFTEKETEFLKSRHVCRLATVTRAGAPHVVPVGFIVDPGHGFAKIPLADVPVTGQNRFWVRNIEKDKRVALTVDYVSEEAMRIFAEGGTTEDRPIGLTLRGHAEIMLEGGQALGAGMGPKWVKVIPSWISSWGIEGHSFESNARKVV